MTDNESCGGSGPSLQHGGRPTPSGGRIPDPEIPRSGRVQRSRSLLEGIAWWRSDTTDFDGGFSLVELVVVLLVVAVLLAIAIPTFLGTQNGAFDRSVQSNLNTALTDAKVQFDGNSQTYLIGGVQDPTSLASALNSQQPALTFKAGSAGTAVTQGSSGSLSDISVAVSVDGNGVVLAAYSVPGNCFYAVDNAQTLSGSTSSVAPYSGTTTVSTTATMAPAGTIGLPVIAGQSYVEVKGDTNKTDCNAYSPKTSGSQTTIRYLTSGFPN